MKDRTTPTEVHLDTALMERLETIQAQQGLHSLEHAMEFLLRRAIRRRSEQLTGRRRALQIVKG